MKIGVQKQKLTANLKNKINPRKKSFKPANESSIRSYFAIMENGKFKDGAELTRESAREGLKINSALDKMKDRPGPPSI